MKFPVLFAFLPLLGACNMHSSSNGNSGDNISINADENGQIAFNLPFIQGQVKVPAATMRGSNFDIDGVKLMPGSSINGFSLTSLDHGSKVNLSFKAPARIDEVRGYFLDQFKEKGVTASANGNDIAGTSKDGSRFTIHLVPADKGTQGMVEVHEKD